MGARQGPSGDQVGTKAGLTSTQKDILDKCKNPLAMTELIKIAGRSNRSKFRKALINPLIDAGYLKMTDPNSPKSPKQKYRTTESGEKILENKE